MVKIRLARHGRKKLPIYSIVAADSRCPRSGRYLEKLGVYAPTGKEILFNLKNEAIRAWVDRGAQMSDTVNSLLKKHKIQY